MCNTNMRKKCGQALDYIFRDTNIKDNLGEAYQRTQALILHDGWISEESIVILVTNGSSFSHTVHFFSTFSGFQYHQRNLGGTLDYAIVPATTSERAIFFHRLNRKHYCIIPANFEGHIVLSRKCHKPVYKGQYLNFDHTLEKLYDADTLTNGNIQITATVTVDTAIMRGR